LKEDLELSRKGEKEGRSKKEKLDHRVVRIAKPSEERRVRRGQERGRRGM